MVFRKRYRSTEPLQEGRKKEETMAEILYNSDVHAHLEGRRPGLWKGSDDAAHRHSVAPAGPGTPLRQCTQDLVRRVVRRYTT